MKKIYKKTIEFRNHLGVLALIVTMLTFPLSTFAQGGGTYFQMSGETNPTVGTTKIYTLSATPAGTTIWSVGAAGNIITSTQTTCEVHWIAAGFSSVSAEETGSGFLPVTLAVNVASSSGQGGGAPGGGGTIIRALNFARAYQVKKPNITEYDDVLTETSAADVMQQTAYFDGLGRQEQMVMKQFTPGHKDFVNGTDYDAFGRVAKQYLPYESSGTNGYYKTGIIERVLFYNSQYNNDTRPFSVTAFEASPMNRPLNSTGPGSAWEFKPVSMNYRFNTAGDGVFKWSGSQKTGVYAANQLMVSETTDEDGKRVVEYTNERGQVILKKVQESDAPGSNHSGWLATYYVYDNQQQLVYVIPPKAVATLSEGATVQTLTTATLNGLCFQYDYDQRGRMVSKRVPGTDDITEMVYDKLNRLVFSRDARQKIAGEWYFTRYDALGRPAFSGVYQSTETRLQLQGTQDVAPGIDVNAVINPVPNNTVSGDYLILDHHKSGTTSYIAKTSIELIEGFEAEGEVVFEIDANLATDHNYIMGYNDFASPSLDNADKVESVTYYDNYSFTSKTFNSSYNSAMTSGTYLVPSNTINIVQGQATGSRTRILGTDQWLESVIFYDDRGRVIQTQTENHKGGLDIVTNTYDFSGKMIYSYQHHKNPEANDFTELRVLKKYSYDHADRLTKVESRNINQEGSFNIIAENTYDALGQLVDKALGNGLQTIDYDYNIRGWITKINDVGTLGSDYFAMELKYNAAGQYNGNIGTIDWLSVGDSNLKRYNYTYDKSNRLKSALYTNVTTAIANEFTVNNIAYDPNGNILSLTRRGKVLNTAKDIDVLGYTYTANTNRLKAVSDTGGNNGIGDFNNGNTSSTDYSYDANGNLTQDLNKNITTIAYNRLNLPSLISFTNNRSIQFVYDAAGIKLQKIVNDDGTITTTDYVGGFIYEGNKLQQFAHEEGRVRQNDQGNLVYDYVIKDHLGNARTTFTTEIAPALIYKATMESENDVDGNNIKAFEESLFYNLENSRVPSVGNVSTPGDDGCTDCNEAAVVNGQTNPIGPAIILDVMPGDVLNLETHAYAMGTVPNNTPNITGVIAALTSAFVPATAGAELATQTSNVFSAESSSVLTGATTSTTIANAYLNYVVFNQSYNAIASGHQKIGGTINASQLLAFNNITISQKGSIYIWVSNESNYNLNVYFDDLKVTHLKGPILQEDHYYPFGATINALSSTAPLSKPNKFKYNGNEEQTEFDLGLYDFNARFYDPSLGRFMQVDPLADLALDWTPYRFAFNNPIAINDPSGLYERQLQGEGGNWWTVDCNDGVCDNAQKNKDGAKNEEDNNDPCRKGYTCNYTFNDEGDLVLIEEKRKKSQNQMFFENLDFIGRNLGGAIIEEGAIMLVTGGAGTAIKLIWKGGKWVYYGLKAYDKVDDLFLGNGKVVLGHFDEIYGYIEKGRKMGASYFDIGQLWEKLTPSQRWAANSRFLDKVIETGEQVYLSVSKGNIRQGSILMDEIKYLQEKGYQWVNQWSLKLVK